jgi:hypothetical protein
MVNVVRIFALIGLSFTLLFLFAIVKALTAEPKPKGQTAQPAQAAVFTPSKQVQDAQAIRDHERLAEKYHELIDELYDFGDGPVAERWNPDE